MFLVLSFQVSQTFAYKKAVGELANDALLLLDSTYLWRDAAFVRILQLGLNTYQSLLLESVARVSGEKNLQVLLQCTVCRVTW